MSSSSPPLEPAPGSLAALSLAIFSDLLSNLTHDLVLQSHRAEKLLRTQQQQHQQHLSALSAPSDNPSTSNEPKMPPGNPLATVPKELFCTRCHLPRHTNETLALGPTIMTETGEKKKFCAKLPWQNQRGHDIYGTPFPNPNAPVKKGAAAAKAGGNGDSPASVGDDAPVKVGKGTGIVYFKCTSCESDKIASSRYAAHLERCLGLSGRKSGRAAMQKMNTNGGSNGGSPMLAPADAAKSGSRKPSPEKQGAGKSGTPGLEDAAVGTIVVAVPASKPAPSSTAPVAPPSTIGNATPKKKKKLAATTGGGIDTKESTPAPSLPPPAIPPPSSAAAVAITKEKKRKRKDELPTDASKPKKHKTSLPPKPKVPATATAPLPLAPSVSPQKNPAAAISSSAPAPQSIAAAPTPSSLPKKPPKPKGPKPKLQQPSATGSPVVPKKAIGGVAAQGKDGSLKKVKKVVKRTVPAAVQPRPSGIPGKSVPGVSGKTVPGGAAPVARKGLPSAGSGGSS